MLVSSAYPQACRTQQFFDREVISRRSAASGHDRPPLFEGIDLFKTNALRDKIIFGTPQLLIRVARARAAKWPSACVSAHPGTGFASNPPLLLAKPSAGNLFWALDYDQRTLRVDSQLNPVYAE